MATDFNLDAIVDFIFAAESDLEFVQRYLDSNFEKSYTQEQQIAIHQSTRARAVSVRSRLHDTLLSVKV